MIAQLIDRVPSGVTGIVLGVIVCLAAGIDFASPAAAQDAAPPNILVIWATTSAGTTSAPTTSA